MDEQTKRREHLQQLVDDHHRHGHGDYADRYADFAAEYGLLDEDGLPVEIEAGSPLERLDIPKYASVRVDETYGIVECHDTLTDAIAGESQSIGEEYLMNPAGVYDLDTGEQIETVQVGLSREAFTVLCGLVQPDWWHAEGPEAMAEAVNTAGIYSDCWDELRATFPIQTFRKAAQERGEDFYHEEAGL